MSSSARVCAVCALALRSAMFYEDDDYEEYGATDAGDLLMKTALGVADLMADESRRLDEAEDRLAEA